MSMLLTPAGQKILSLGPRVAMQLEVERKVDMQMHFDLESHSIRNLDDERSTRDIISVTKDLERMVEDISDDDVLMDSFIPTATPTTAQPAPPVVTPSWVLVKGEDWEMIDSTRGHPLPHPLSLPSVPHASTLSAFSGRLQALAIH